METELTPSWGDWMNGRRERVYTQSTLKLVPTPGELTDCALWSTIGDASNVARSFIVCDGGLQLDWRLT